ncbi:inosine-5'-monophosphate dehydrogenase [Fadolivirus algeromassiliense]|jgi:IMP dehydrogenase|uniref:Inosine-5'-monophosphate dehydrogenase n=1 Tax=Fadolivirus FV1/VV64 TaxID=3070911 RepID=A0A7D3R1M4_9VIRU|nr:inosine-5'-monophosphate dehydrogenase [Fadolivirus algeromassiliense]QKF93918.1 inosine-5'-monophosphate dehydrogenase [Fadolivirus FV1/VV64]
MEIPLSLTFDDVLLIPQYSDIRSRQDICIKSKISKNVPLNIPFVSSNMDTVTEDMMAIAMARLGGIGIIHRYCSIEEQIEMVKRVKRAESYMIYNPYTAFEDETILDIKNKINKYNVRSYLIVDNDNVLKGILTSRDIKFTNDTDLIRNCMTPLDKMVVCKTQDNITIDTAKRIMCDNKIQKLPIIDENNRLISLICLKDIERIQHRPMANLDSHGRLRVGAAVGVKEDALERAIRLVDAGADVLVIDIAHGHSKMCIDTLKSIKKALPNIDVIAGNVATAEGAEALIQAGADGIKCGIGNGSICTTRLTAGAGVPQLTALMEASKVCRKYNIPLISDGGNRHYGNMAKALGARADCIMLGRMIAGSEESPGKVLMKDGKRVKIIRGMAGVGANVSNAQRQGIKEPDLLNFTPEGVEGYVPYSGPVQDSIRQMCDAIRSGMSYSGAHNIEEMHNKARFTRVTQNGISESGVHDISQL